MIYLIKTGEYSDTTIHGYFSVQEDAVVYCYIRNNQEHRTEEYEKYYVDSVEELTVDFQKRPPLYYKFYYDYTQTENSGWELEPQGCSCFVDTGDPLENTRHFKYNKYGILAYHVVVSIKCKQPEVAYRLAMDHIESLKKTELELNSDIWWDGSESDVKALRPGDLCEFNFQYSIKRKDGAVDWERKLTGKYLLPKNSIHPEERNCAAYYHTVIPNFVYVVTVVIDEHDQDKAQKIAQDYFAWLRAEGKIDD